MAFISAATPSNFIKNLITQLRKNDPELKELIIHLPSLNNADISQILISLANNKYLNTFEIICLDKNEKGDVSRIQANRLNKFTEIVNYTLPYSPVPKNNFTKFVNTQFEERLKLVNPASNQHMFIMLAKSLKINRSIKKLIISRCLISDETLKIITESLLINNVLKQLELR